MKKTLIFTLLTLLFVACDPNSPNDPTNESACVVTDTVQEITHHSVVFYGEVNVSNTDYESVEWGVMYSTNKTDLQARQGMYAYRKEILTSNEYTISLQGLDSETKYYYCAFVYLNDEIHKYGEIKEFTTLVAPKVEHLGAFSVSDTKQITFSPGNLQYNPTDSLWQFASSQLEYLSEANLEESSDYTGWVDLLVWKKNTYGHFVDWGTNKIGNDAPNTWRTLTHEEWSYLYNGRDNAEYLFGIAQLGDVKGLIFLPDNWVCPAGLSFKAGFCENSGADYYAGCQKYTLDEWSKLEAAGAVFLPAAGHRCETKIFALQIYGYYWTATNSLREQASYFEFIDSNAKMSACDKYIAQSVRLVKDL